MPIVRSGRTEAGPCYGPDCDHVSHQAEAEQIEAADGPVKDSLTGRKPKGRAKADAESDNA